MRRSLRAKRIAFRLPPYNLPHVVPCNSPVFRVDRTQAAGGVCEQTFSALPEYICRCFCQCDCMIVSVTMRTYVNVKTLLSVTSSSNRLTSLLPRATNKYI